MTFKFAFWAVLALLLFAAETMAPGAFMLWFGFAAAAMAAVVWVLPGLGWLTQSVLFAVFSVASIAVYIKWFRNKGRASDKPLLNRRADQLVGEVVKLDQPITSGRGGRVQIADAFWSVEGPDLPVGALVRIVATNGMVLKVQQA
jgi:membrane protein implicated in regulation of membrane protease activity